MKKNILLPALLGFTLLCVACGGGEQAAPAEETNSDQTEATASDEEMEVLEESEALHSKTSEANAKLDSIMNNL